MNTNLGDLTLGEFKDVFLLWQKIKNNPKLQWLRSYKRISQSPDPIIEYEELDIFLKSTQRKITFFKILIFLLSWTVVILSITTAIERQDAWNDVLSSTKKGGQIMVIFVLLMTFVTIVSSLLSFSIERLTKMLLDSHLSRLWTTREFFSDVKMLAQTCGDGPGNPEVLEARNEMTTDIAPEHVFKIVRAYLVTQAGVILSNFSSQRNPDMHELCKRCLKENLETFKRFRIFKTSVHIEFAYDAAKAATKLAKAAVQQ